LLYKKAKAIASTGVSRWCGETPLAADDALGEAPEDVDVVVEASDCPVPEAAAPPAVELVGSAVVKVTVAGAV